MALNKLTVSVDSRGLGRKLATNDHISGIVFYHDTLPSGFGASDRVKRVKSIEEAEALGIVDTRTDETKATGGQVTITAPGAAGDINTISITPAGGSAIALGSYTVVSGDAVNDVAAGLRAAINAGTNTHGFSAGGSTAVVELTAATGYGDGLNGSGLAFASDGTGAGTVVQFSGGVDAFYDVMHYHISEYFRIQPKGDLYIGIYAVSGGIDLSKLEEVQNFALGEIRQIAVYDHNTTFASGQIGTLQSSAVALANAEKRCSVLYAADYSGLTLSALPNLRALASDRVSVVIAEDATIDTLGEKSIGKDLVDEKAYSITCIGAALGAVSLASVSENIANIERFNLVQGIELLEPGFAEGTKFKAIGEALETQLHDYGYIYIKNHQGISGTYFNDSSTAEAATDDFAYIESVRTIDKAIRVIRTALLPKLNGQLLVDAEGKLSFTTISIFESLAQKPIDGMITAQELSDGKIVIDPDQDVLGTSEIAVTAELIPVGIARKIVLKIGFTTALSA
jgi:hypothetical protein